MSSPSSIAIAGCGIGGLALACALAEQGHDITIFDRFETPQPVGSGLVIQPVGQNCLARINVLDAAIARGRQIYQLRGTESASKRTVLKADYGRWNGPNFGLAIHRSDLFECLYEAAQGRGVTLTPSTEIISTDTVSNGRTITSANGAVLGPFDLVVDASGAHSPLSPIHTNALPYGALWGTVMWPSETQIRPDCLTQCYNGAHNMLGVLPLHDDKRTAIFWSEPTDQLAPWYESDLDAWKAKSVSLWPEFEPFVSQITAHSDMTAARYRHGTLSKPYGDRIAFIGDAAHQASPQLGQGANMALLDAMALANALAQHTLEEAPKAYAQARRIHVHFYQAVSKVFTPFYQSGNPVYPWVRNTLMHPTSQIWPANRILTSLISGNLAPTGV